MFRHHQTVQPTGEIRSVQSLALPALRPDKDAGRRYFAYLRRFLWPILNVKEPPDGAAELRAFGLLLLAFGTPLVLRDGDSLALRYPIIGGLFAQPEHQREGYLEIAMHPDRVSLTVDGYFSRIVGAGGGRLRRLVYLLTQSALHIRVARGFLTALATRRE